MERQRRQRVLKRSLDDLENIHYEFEILTMTISLRLKHNNSTEDKLQLELNSNKTTKLVYKRQLERT